MTDSVLHALQATKDQTEKAAIVAEATFAILPEKTALAARRCIVLHWFNQFIVEALLEECELTLDQMSEVYKQLATLPFIDTVPWGLTFHETTRQGLLKDYSTSDPEVLKTAAQMAAPAYEANEEEKRSIAEAFFCYIVAGDQASSTALQSILFEEASKQQDWHYLDNLLQLQAEAERFPFVRPLPRSEQQLLLQGLVHRIQGKREDALLNYQQALTINPKSVLAYVSRGTTYAEQERDEEALSAYNTALKLDSNFAPAYLSRGVLYTKQAKYKEALKDTNKAQSLGLNTDALFINKGNIFNELGQYEDALVACDAALRLNQEATEAYISRGQALIGLERYQEALLAYDEALNLNPATTKAYLGKGQALNGLQNYNEALVTFQATIRLNPNIADAYRGMGQALSNLKRYEEAAAAYEKADHLGPPTTEASATYEDIDGDSRQPRRSIPTENPGPVPFFRKAASRFPLLMHALNNRIGPMSNTTPLHNHSLLFDYVRQIRAEALNLHETATDLTTTLNDTTLSDSDALMRTHHAILIGNKIIQEHGPQVQTCFDRIDTILQQHPELNNWDGNDVGGDITTIRDAWDKTRWNWPASSDEQLLTKQQLQYQLADIAQSLLHLCVTAQMLTFPDLVNQKLSQMRTGEKLDFFSEFSDAFFKPEFLPIAWTYLRNHPRHIDGFMTDNGIIYRASHSQQKRMLSLFLIAVSVGTGFLLIWLSSILFPQLGSLDVLFKGYGAVIVGGLVHTFVEVWKQYKTQPDHTANIMDNWTLWVHVKEHSIIYGIITLWAGFIILIIIGQIQDISAAFFAGYSVDSLLGLFLTRFTDTASQRVQALDTSIPKSTAQQVADQGRAVGRETSSHSRESEQPSWPVYGAATGARAPIDSNKPE